MGMDCHFNDFKSYAYELLNRRVMHTSEEKQQLQQQLSAMLRELNKIKVELGRLPINFQYDDASAVLREAEEDTEISLLIRQIKNRIKVLPHEIVQDNLLRGGQYV